MDDKISSTALHLDEHDINAIVGLLIRVIRIDDANRADKARLDEINKAVSARGMTRPKYVSGIGAFGFEMKGSDVWKKVRAAIGDEAYDRAVAIAKGVEKRSDALDSGAKQSQAVEQQESDDDGHEDIEGLEQDIPKIRDAILTYLRSLPDTQGAQVPEIKSHLADAFGIETHEKTPGMTLYRLSKDELVRRDGRTWFAVKAPVEDTFDQIKAGTSQ